MADAAVTVTLKPGTFAGAAPAVSVSPESSCFIVANRALTVEGSAGKEIAASVEAKEEKVVLHITGEVPMKSTAGVVVKLAVKDPDLTTACYFGEQLSKAGVRVTEARPKAGSCRDGYRPAATETSDPLVADVKRMQEWSRNFVAEQLLKLLSPERCKQASFRCGAKVLRRTLPLFHVPAGCFKLTNASGLFNVNEFTPAQVVRFLVEGANRGDIAADYVDSFAVSGRTGTMKERLRNMDRRVRAKTGTLDDVSSLAGYVHRSEGRTIVFAILFNKATASAERLRTLQDRIVGVFGTWAEGKLR
jgi:D-alanyl-D-alanine carboxypeptidase/D-alanyl-D-alanine-endopeptidase (penicillin-binding protein 4)